MSRFGRAISHLKSTQIDEKIKFLNKELEKTGVVCEAAPANSTANLSIYSNGETTTISNISIEEVTNDLVGYWALDEVQTSDFSTKYVKL